MPTAGIVSVVRRALDGLYLAAGFAAAACVALILLTTLVQIVARAAGITVLGLTSYAGYLMAGAGFLALAHTLKRGEHIRVTLLVGRLAGRAQRAAELWALFAATLLAALGAFYSVRLAWQSWQFHDISTSNDATPLWIPQLTMAIGTVVLAIAFVDELVLEARGKRLPPLPEEASHNE